MKKAVVCAFLFCFIMLSGCQSPSPEESGISESTIESEASDFEGLDPGESLTEDEAGDLSGLYDDYDGDAGPLWNEGASDGLSAFEPYEIKVQRNELSVYDQPGYHTGNWLYDITDRRIIIIVAEETVRENGNIRRWGQLQSGGWVSLTAADVVEDEEEAEPDVPPANNNEAEPTEPGVPSPPDAVESTPQETPPALGGTLIDSSANVYGCGGEHTEEVNGIMFHWYDRYEHRNKENTMVFSSVDVLSFQMRYAEWETEIHQNDLWYIDYEIEASGGSSAKLRWFTYDKNQYRKSDVPVLNGELKEKCSGTAYFAESQMPPSVVAFAELAPSMYGRS